MARAAAWAQKKAPRRFRSRWSAYCAGVARRNGVRAKTAALLTRTSRRPRRRTASRTSARASRGRSEEHTSELQSLAYLVCRLLLEKKKKTKCALAALSVTRRRDTES